MAHSNIECVSLELQRFWGVSKNDRDKLRAKFGWRLRCRRARAPQPGPVDQVARLPETPVAFARWFLCGIETAITFAGEKGAFLACFSGAEVMAVSTVPCCGLCSGAVGFIVLHAGAFWALGMSLLGTRWGLLHDMKPSGRVSSACRTPM